MSERFIIKGQTIRWSTTTRRVDLETGEEITKHNAETNYIKIKTEKHVSFNFHRTKAVVEYTIGYQKDLKLF